MPPKPSKMTWQQRDAWEREQRAMIDAKMADVAQALDFTLEVSQERNTCMLVKGVHRVHVYFDAHHNRLAFSGSFSHELLKHRRNGSSPDPECRITVDPDRSAAQIATAITRRLIPVAHGLYNKLSARHDAHMKQKRTKDALAQEIAANSRGHVVEPSPYSGPDPLRHPRTLFGATGVKARNEPYGCAEVSDFQGLHVTMTLHNVPPELAVYIASLFGEYAEEEEPS